MKKKLFAITLLLSFYMMACGTKGNVNPVESEVAIETEVETAVIKEESEVRYPKDSAENKAESVQVTEVNTEEDAVELVKKTNSGL